MPYNTTPMPPPEEATGTSRLPLARVKKIIAQDEDISQCSNAAAFAIAIATENFIWHLTQQAHNVVKSERKPRRTIMYKDIADAVARVDNLEFLSDVVPKTKSYRQFKKDKVQDDAAKAKSHVTNGERPASSSGNIQDLMQPQTNGQSTTNGHPHSPMADRTASRHPDPIRDLGSPSRSISPEPVLVQDRDTSMTG